MPLIVLASTSRYRRELMSRLDVEFETAAPDYDEEAQREHFESMTDEAFALMLGGGKADSLARRFDAHVIVAADQIAVLPGPPRELLHKPGSEAAAIEQLMRLSGRTHHLTTGVVVLDTRTGERHQAVDRQTMTMRAFDRDEATRYVTRFQPLDCCGSYRIEDPGVALFERIDGHDYTGIIGLPLLSVARLLRRVGAMT